jgi:hypothetical protein
MFRIGKIDEAKETDRMDRISASGEAFCAEQVNGLYPFARTL